MSVESYVFDANIYCGECAEAMGMLKPGAFDVDGNEPSPILTENQATADSPQHCGDCHVFLENPLTDHGVDYVIQALQDYGDERGDQETLSTWATFYADDIREKADLFFDLEMSVTCEDIGNDALLRDLIACARPGEASEACERVLNTHNVVAHPSISAHLRGYSAWDAAELADRRENTLRMIWRLGCALNQYDTFYVSSSGADPVSANEASDSSHSPG